MELKLVRHTFVGDNTIGTLYVNGRFQCVTLEDKDRDLWKSETGQFTPLSVIQSRKVYGQTCIPYGRYKIEMIWWDKHKRNVPHLIDVPGFTGILIHSGVTVADTLGCILVGDKFFTDRLENTTSSRIKLDKIITDALKSGDEVWITIEKLEHAV